jgi:AraC-like DNA-binding protein
VEHAARLLAEGGEPISMIALAAGLAARSHDPEGAFVARC